MVLIDTSRGLRQQIVFAVYLSLLRPKTETETTINFIFIMGAWKVFTAGVLAVAAEVSGLRVI